MDFISHGLWGGIAFGRENKRNFWIAFVIGIAPDILSFGVLLFVSLLGLADGPRFSHGPPDPATIPSYIDALYNLTHSLVIFAAAFLILWAIFKKPFILFLSWGLHIILDIFTHSFEFFPTPFLWPVSDYKLDAWMWGNYWIFIPNVVLLIVLYSWFFIAKFRKKKNNLEQTKS